MAPTPVDIPEDPELRDNYAQGAAWHPASGRFAGRTGSKEGKKAAGAPRAGGAAESGAGKGQRARRRSGQAPAQTRPTAAATRALQPLARQVPQLRPQDHRQQIDGQRDRQQLAGRSAATQLANNKREAAERMAAQAEQRARASAVRANSGRHSYEPLRKFTSAMIDTGDITQPPRAEGSKELIRQAQAADQQAGHQLDARDREAARVQKRDRASEIAAQAAQMVQALISRQIPGYAYRDMLTFTENHRLSPIGVRAPAAHARGPGASAEAACAARAAAQPRPRRR